MEKNLGRLANALDKVGAGGVIIAALSCTACFPALGVLAAGLGLGFLSQFEGVAINKMLPLFAGIALVANCFGWTQHRRHWRGLLCILGPLGILATLYPLWKYAWSTNLFYVSLLLMLGVSIADLIWPPKRVCPLPSGSRGAK